MGNAALGESLKSASSCGPLASVAACPGPCDPLAEDDDRNEDSMEYRDGVLTPVPAIGSSVCCLKGSIGSLRAPKDLGDSLLRRYFLGAYRDGAEPEEIRGYALERIDTGTYVWVHGESGISVWSEVVNVAAEATPVEDLQLLFHYCGRAAFTHVTNENRKDAELFASLVEPDGLFGSGIYSSVYEPAIFGGRKSVIENNFRAELDMDRQMGYDLNHWLERVSFCIPIIAQVQMCHDVRSRPTPEMVFGRGRDKHGMDIHPGRDLWVVRIKDEDRCAHNAAASYEAVLRRRLVRHEGIGARERAVQDMVSLGRHLRRRGRHQEALMAFEKALQINLAIHGASHPAVATSYNEMAVVYHRHCQYAQALEYYERTLNIQLETLGKAHPHVASTYNNMAVVYGRQGDHSKALEFYQKAHDIKVETLGEFHPSVAATFHNMGNIYRRQNEYAKALEYYDKALQIRLSSLGDTHPSVGDTYYNMGMLFRWMHRPGEVQYKDKALKAFRAAYKAYLETYGPDNQETRDAKQQMLLEQTAPGATGHRLNSASPRGQPSPRGAVPPKPLDRGVTDLSHQHNQSSQPPGQGGAHGYDEEARHGREFDDHIPPPPPP